MVIVGAGMAGRNRPTHLNETAGLSFVQTGCSPSTDGEIVVCGRHPDRPGHRIETRLPPSPTVMEDIGNALIVRKGPIEFGVGAGTVYFKLKF
jgi:hypothetical protein